MPEPSLIDARLAEIDRRLRTIQSGLAPAPEPPPPPVAPVAPPAPTPLHAVAPPPPLSAADQADRLITRLRGLVDAHEGLLAQTRGMLSAGQPTAAMAPAPAPAPVSVSAGPFAGTAQLRDFAAAVRELPGVREVVVREFAGGDRAVIDVHLAAPIS